MITWWTDYSWKTVVKESIAYKQRTWHMTLLQTPTLFGQQPDLPNKNPSLALLCRWVLKCPPLGRWWKREPWAMELQRESRRSVIYTDMYFSRGKLMQRIYKMPKQITKEKQENWPNRSSTKTSCNSISDGINFRREKNDWIPVWIIREDILPKLILFQFTTAKAGRSEDECFKDE